MTDDPRPMTLGNMRSLGVRSVDVECFCKRRTILNVDRFPDHQAVPALAERFRCADCGKRPRSVRPDWTQLKR